MTILQQPDGPTVADTNLPDPVPFVWSNALRLVIQ